MACQQCGTLVTKGMRFCPNCGKAVLNAPAPVEDHDGASNEVQDRLTVPTDMGEGRKSRRRWVSIILWTGILCILGFAFLMSMFLYPVVIALLGVPILLVLTNFKGSGKRLVNSWAWRHWRLPWTKTVTPAVGITILGLWIFTSTVFGRSVYSNDAAIQAQHVAATRTAVARVTATAHVVAHTTAVAKARARAIAQATAAPKETATATARKKAAAIARAHAHATYQVLAVARAHAQATRQARVVAAHAQATQQAQAAAASVQATQQAQAAAASAQATQAAQPVADTYTQVNDHPGLYKGNYIQWTCNIYGFLDSHTIGCDEYTGTFDGSGDGPIILDTSNSHVDTNYMNTGDDVSVYGRVEDPAQGTNAFGGTVTSPQIAVISITDLGHDANGNS